MGFQHLHLSPLIVNKINASRLVRMVQAYFPAKSQLECIQWAIADMDAVSTEAEDLEKMKKERAKARQNMPKTFKKRKKRR